MCVVLEKLQLYSIIQHTDGNQTGAETVPVADSPTATAHGVPYYAVFDAIILFSIVL